MGPVRRQRPQRESLVRGVHAAGLRRGKAVPLVVVLHGCNQSVTDAALGTEVNVFADRAGFVALYPVQSIADNRLRCWNWFEPGHQSRGAGEPAAIARITEQVLSRGGGARLDRNRVHVMGLSAGGAMAGILAVTYPDVYASVGIHSAPQYRAARSPLTAVLAMKNGGPDPVQQGRLAHTAMGTAGAGCACHRGSGRGGPDSLGRQR